MQLLREGDVPYVGHMGTLWMGTLWMGTSVLDAS
jgi:hypothetical protein